MEIVHDRIHDTLTNTLPLIVWMNRDIDNFKVAATITNHAAHRDQLPLITYNGGKQRADCPGDSPQRTRRAQYSAVPGRVLSWE